MPLDRPIKNIEKLFADYLESLGVALETLKNYKSDLSHFRGWLLLRVRAYGVFAEELSEAIPFVSHNIVLEYKNFLTANRVPVKSVNRRLSTLRHLARFFLFSQVLTFDFMEGIGNIGQKTANRPFFTPFILDFEKHLRVEKVSNNTIKNYLSDVRQFFAWIERQDLPLKN